MEKNMTIISRYHYIDGYFIEVTREDSFTSERDYWLCNRKSNKKLYMFTALYRNDDKEEELIGKYLFRAIKKYEQPEEEINYHLA